MLAEAEIVVFILSVDVYQTVDFKSVRINKGLVSFPGGSVMKNSPASAGDTGSVPGWGRFPRKGNSNPLPYSCLENSMDRGAWQSTVHGVTKSQTPPRNWAYKLAKSYTYRSSLLEILYELSFWNSISCGKHPLDFVLLGQEPWIFYSLTYLWCQIFNICWKEGNRKIGA